MNYLNLDAALNGEYKDAYQRVCTYAVMKGYTDEMIEEQMNELFDMLKTAQSEGTPVKRITGSDIDSFLRGFFSDYGVKERIIDILSTVYRLAVLVLIFAVIDIFAADKPKDMFLNGSFGFGAVFGGFAPGVLVSVISSKFFSPFLGRTGKANMGRWFAAVLGLEAVLLTGELVLYENFKDKLSFISLSVFVTCIVSALYITVFLVLRAVYRYKTYGTVRNIKKQIYEKSVRAHIDDEMTRSITLESWGRIHDRMIKKGKTEQDFEKKVNKILSSNRSGNKWFTVFMAVIVAVMIINVAIDSTLYDTVFFALVLGSIEFIVWRFFIKTFNSSAAAQEWIINSARDDGKSVYEFINDTLSKKKS